MSKNLILHGDCLDVLQRYVPESAANLIVTSPPYGNQRKHNYGGIEPAKYVSWFLKRADEFMRVLTVDGSMILNICPHVENGVVVGYVDELLAALREIWYFKAIYFWRKTTILPLGMRYSPRLKNAVEPCYHFALRQKPAFYPDQVMKPASPASTKNANRLKVKELERQRAGTESGIGCNHAEYGRSTETANGSGFSLNTDREAYIRRPRNNGSPFGTTDANCNGDADGLVYPDNVIEAAPETRNLHRLYGDPRDKSMASAAFPEKLPAFFIDLFTRKSDVVLDPFSGSGTTAKVAQDKGRGFIAIEKEAANIRLILNRLQDKRNPYPKRTLCKGEAS